MTLAREAAIIANKAEKTRIARSLDILSNTLKAQADYIDSIVQMQARRSGANAQTMALSATAQSLREQIKKLQGASGTVASLPTVPPQAPTQQRIADLANKFNLRTAAENKFNRERAVISVLSDLAENPMSQAKDYPGALSYYGVDGPGRVMADMEYGNVPGAMAGLRGMVHGVGYFETTQVMAQADDLANAAHKVAAQTYAEVILPAAGLGGLSALGGEWEDWCDKNVPTGATDAAKDYNKDVAKCRAKPNLVAQFQAPWTLPGRQARGAQVDWWKGAGQVATAISQGVTSITTPPPPVAAQPPPQVTVGATGGGATGSSSSSMTAPEDNTGLYVAIGVGSLLAIGGVFWLVKSRKSAAPALPAA
jgi:hypothetical protein